MTALELADLEGENIFVILGTVRRALKALDRTTGSKLADALTMDVDKAGSYERACTIIEGYAVQYLRHTLNANVGDLTGEHDDRSN